MPSFRMLFLISPRIKDFSQKKKKKMVSRVVVLKFLCTLKSPAYSHLILLFQLITPPVLRLSSSPVKLDPWSWDPSSNILSPWGTPMGSQLWASGVMQCLRNSMSIGIIGGREGSCWNAVSAVGVLGGAQPLHCISHMLSGDAGTTSSQTTLSISRTKWTLDFFLPESRKNGIPYSECTHWSLPIPHDSPQTKFELVATRNYLHLHVQNSALSAEAGSQSIMSVISCKSFQYMWKFV